MILENSRGDQKGWGFPKTQELEFVKARDSRGCRTGLDAWESQQRALRNVAIKCIKIETKIHHKKHKRDRIGLNQKPRGHKEDGCKDHRGVRP